MDNTCDSNRRPGKESKTRGKTYRWTTEQIVSAASEMLRTGGRSARREVVRITLELDRLLGEAL